MFNQNNFYLHIALEKIRYWQKQLADIAPLIDFPTDRPRSNIGDSATDNKCQPNLGQEQLILSQDLNLALNQVAKQEQAPFAVVLLAAFQSLLYRYTSQEDIVVGCLDLFDAVEQNTIEILPIRVFFQGQQSFSLLLEVNQARISEAQDNFNLSFENLSLGLTQDNSDFSLAFLSQMLFRYQSGKAKSTVSLPKPELFLNIFPEESNLRCEINYDRHLYSATAIKRVLANYQVLLQAIAKNPQQNIADLPLISPEEQFQVLEQWNQTATEFTASCVHQLFEVQAARNPKAIALICQGEQLTYGELNTRANQLAHYLKDRGVCSQSLVGLCIERSLSMVVGILAILKAGGAYVPLDISNPAARLSFILEDARVNILITQSSLLDKLPSQVEQAVCLNRDWHLISEYSQDNLELDTISSDLAHIVYTSGSTGKPKGVMLTHGNLSHYAQSLQAAWNITPADIYLHRGSIALIVSARQLLMPLAQGATALILTAQEGKDPLKLFELVKHHRVTILDHVPSFWRNFAGIVEQLESDRRSSLLDNQVRLVAAGGEQVTPEIYQCWRKIFKPGVQLANIYGQTEGTGVVTIYSIPEAIDFGFKSLPVGYPIPNMKVYLLDQNLQPVPVGVAAEIHISGAGVAQGYLNRPKLTAEKFVANPYDVGERLYKTGDLGRRLSNGSIQFLGRVDRQVNIQGLRIELGEIEAVLSNHSQVQEAAVVVQENKLGESLAVFVVPNKLEQPSVDKLRNYLQEKLPAYMVPGTWSFLTSFPLTTSGKIDYRALSALNTIKTNFTAPRDRLESELCQMLQEILGIDTIGIEDSFLELGGNSLLAARLVAEIEAKYQLQIAVSTVFQASTIKNLATLIRQEQELAMPKCLVPIRPGFKVNLFAIHNLGYGMEFYRPLGKHLHPDLDLCGLSSFLSNELDKPHPRDIKRLAAYYSKNLQQVQPQGPYYLLGVSFGGVIAYEIAQLLVSSGHEVRFLGMVDTFCPSQNSVRKYLPLQQRLQSHFAQVRARGVEHIFNRIKWRISHSLDIFRANLYQINWVRNNLVDQTTRKFDQAEYIRLTREHDQVNQDYTIQPYPGKITLFRATEDPDSKLDWQELAQSGLAIYDIPGEHLEILQEPKAEMLAEKIQLAINN